MDKTFVSVFLTCVGLAAAASGGEKPLEARVPPGVYIWRVEIGPASAAKKCVVN